jgi:hypothetical protein
MTNLKGVVAAQNTELGDAVLMVMAERGTGDLRPLTAPHPHRDELRGGRARLVASAKETLRLARGELEPEASMPATTTSKAAEYRAKMPILGDTGDADSSASEAAWPAEVPLEAAVWDMTAAASEAASLADLDAVITKAEAYEAHWGEDKFKNGTSWRGAKRRSKCGVEVPGSACQTWRNLTPIRKKLEGKAQGSAERASAIAQMQIELGECDGRTFDQQRRALVRKWVGEKEGNEAAIEKSREAGSKPKNRKKKQKTGHGSGD